ncbi:endonuclease domain-containing protein [Mycolicibacterium anyangense]|nr:hypothetical protein [Mycolicibacterium anyangense]
MQVFIGSEALAAGAVSRYELCSAFERLLPDVYAPKGTPLTLADRTLAAWLWSKRRGVVAGLAAAALHRAKWIDDSAPIELIYSNNKSPKGVVARQETLFEAEVIRLGDMSMTTVERTAFDLARRGSIVEAVARIDALARATGFKADDVLAVADRHPHVRGVRRISKVLDLMDGGAQSPKESWLRVLLIEAGFPRPQTQIPVLAPDGYPRYFLDLGWPDLKIAVEYDGEQHRTDRMQYRGDVTRSEYIQQLGWRRIRVLAGDRGPDVIRRVERVWPR